MKYFVAICILIFGSTTFAGQVEIRLFGSAGCEQCERVEFGILREAQELYPDAVLAKTLIDDIEGFKELLKLEEKYGDDRNESVKVFVGMFPDYVRCLAGVDEIEAELIGALADAEAQTIATVSLQKPVDSATAESSAEDFALRRIEQFTIGAVITAGLLDGINPCVFSTLVFFMGLLAASQVKGHRLLIIGLSFCFGSFVMYTAMGFGALQLLRSFWGFEVIQSSIKWLMVAAMAYFSFDAFRGMYQMKKNYAGVGDTCSLPVGVMGRIHRAVSSGLNARYLVPGAFGAGLVVTAFESMCTGQVYVPTLVLIIKSGVSELTGWLYLLLFNIACITPLLIIFVLVYNGMNFSLFEQWSQKNARQSKLLLALFFLTMGIVMIVI